MSHARLSPSDSGRWLNCALSIPLDDLHPQYEDEVSIEDLIKNWEEVPEKKRKKVKFDASTKGTLCHAWSERVIAESLGLDCEHLPEVPDGMLLPDHLGYAKAYVDSILALVEDLDPVEYGVETKVRVREPRVYVRGGAVKAMRDNHGYLYEVDPPKKRIRSVIC